MIATAAAAGRGVIKIFNNVIDLALLAIIILLLFFAGYALWDSEQIFHAADKSHYAVYKPTAADEGKSFKELQAVNGEVFAWLQVYGTNIDYPVTQGRDNMKYVNTNAEGQYSLSGAIFLDSGNSMDFSDFNSILYGHHMEKNTMFGEIGSFADGGMFETHRYGNLYFDEKDHGIEFFAFVHTDAYDNKVFAPNIKDSARQQAYLDNLIATAIHGRDLEVTISDHIILLSTCSSSSTNGRDILVGVISDTVYEDSYANSNINNGSTLFGGVDYSGAFEKAVSMWPIYLLIITVVVLILSILVIFHRRKQINDATDYRR
jgi:sortase B